MIIDLNVDLGTSLTAVQYFRSKFTNDYDWFTPAQWLGTEHDLAVLSYLIRTYGVRSVCEIGTWRGYTALFMWLEKSVTRLKAIDICENYGSPYHKDLDHYGMYFTGITPCQLERADTRTYVVKDEDRYDLVFIDGNHEYHSVKNDYRLVSGMQPKIIAFHDYHNGNSGVDLFLTELGRTTRLYSVNDSCVVFQIIGDPESVDAP